MPVGLDMLLLRCAQRATGPGFLTHEPCAVTACTQA